MMKGLLMLETSASESLYGCQFTLSTQLIKPNYLMHYGIHIEFQVFRSIKTNAHLMHIGQFLEHLLFSQICMT